MSETCLFGVFYIGVRLVFFCLNEVQKDNFNSSNRYKKMTLPDNSQDRKRIYNTALKMINRCTINQNSIKIFISFHSQSFWLINS